MGDFPFGMEAALTVAGSDSSGGAGVQADIKAFASANVHGCAVVTCVTAQNTQDVLDIYPVPASIIQAQLSAVLSDIRIGAAKTGMLHSAEIVSLVSEGLREVDFPLVVDPVLVATVGDSLHTEGLVESLKKELLPAADILTPNVHEAAVLSGIQIDTIDDVRRSSEVIHEMGPAYVLVKGGHIGESANDILYDGKDHIEFKGHRFEGDGHGSGCAYSALIAAFRAKGLDVIESVLKAKKRISLGFLFGYGVGNGASVVNSHYVVDKYAVWKELAEAIDELKAMLPVDYVPEVGMNFGYALPLASGVDDVCALTGRLTRVGDKLSSTGYPDFGGSKHVASIILAAGKFDPAIRSAINLRYSSRTLRRCEDASLTLASFDRSKEPEGVSSMEWGTRQAIMDAGSVPDAIHDEGAKGKEPMIRLLGRNPSDVLSKLRKIVRGMG